VNLGYKDNIKILYTKKTWKKISSVRKEKNTNSEELSKRQVKKLSN